MAAIKEKVARHPWAKAAYDALIAAAEDWAKKKVELPDRGGQSSSLYWCPKCAVKLRTVDATTHECPGCGKVYSGEPYDSVVVGMRHMALAQGAEDLGLAYQLTGETRYAGKACEILEGYAKRYLTYPRHDAQSKDKVGGRHPKAGDRSADARRDTQGKDKVGGGRIGAQILMESRWLVPIVRAYDLVWETLTPQQRTRIEDELLRPAAQLIMEERAAIDSIQCWKNSAVGLVGLCLDDWRVADTAIAGTYGLHRQLSGGIPADGLWHQGSWDCHYDAMAALVPLTEAMRHGGTDMYGGPYKRLFLAPLLFALPNGRLPALNDSAECDADAAWPQYELAYARWREPLFAAALKGKPRTARESLLYGVPELGPDAPLPTGSRNFAASGLAYLQCDEGRDAPVAILDYGPHGGGHGHPDKLQLLLYAQGESVAPDPGGTSSALPLHGEWYRETISHNTVAVDEKPQKPCQGTLRGFHATPELALAAASADDAYDGVRFARTVAMMPGGVVVDLVELASRDAHAYDWAFHSYGDFTTPLALQKDFETLGNGGGYQHIRQTVGCVTPDPVAARWLGEKAAVHLAVLPAKATRVFAGDGYGQPATRKLPTFILRRWGREATFASALRVGGKDARPVALSAAAAPDGRQCLVVTADDETAALLIPLSSARALEGAKGNLPPQLAIATDGEAAVVRLKAGKLRAVVLAGGRRLEAGPVAVRLSRTATVCVQYDPGGSSKVTVITERETTVRLTGLFADKSEVTAPDGRRVEASWSKDTLSFPARSGCYTLR